MKIIEITLILLITLVLRFYNLLYDSPYFPNPDERNMAGAITQFRLPQNISKIPRCIITEFFISHPDTDNQPLKIDSCSLNPHFFAYGQFPLYLAFISDQIAKPFANFFTPEMMVDQDSLNTSFANAIFWLRFYSALSSVLTVLLVYLISLQLFTLNFSLLTATLVAFSPGLIQAAHFGTTESLLTFFFMAAVYLSISYLSNLGHLKFILFSSLIIGLSLGSKLTGIFFFIPPAISLIIRIIELFRRRMKFLTRMRLLFFYWIIGLLVFIGSITIGILSSPYNLVEPNSFKSAVFGYEMDVATGKYDAFYTKQFIDSLPVLFQAEKIFPYVLGWPTFIMGSAGLLVLIVKTTIYPLQRLKKRMKQYSNASLLQRKNWVIGTLCIVTFIFYFIPNSFIYAKWTRFMTPILPFFSISAAYFLFKFSSLINLFFLKIRKLKIKNQNYNSKIKILHFNLSFYILHFAFLILAILPGIAFMSIYTHDDSRVTASRWIYQNIPEGSYILSETANVVDIPLGLPEHDISNRNYAAVVSFDFYHLHENPLLFDQLLTHLEKADYIFIPSRRIFKNFIRKPEKYQLVTKYHQLLFSGALGFEKATEISSFPQLTINNYQLAIFSDEDAEETYTVFDHPVIRIYRKVKPLTREEYQSLFFD